MRRVFLLVVALAALPACDLARRINVGRPGALFTDDPCLNLARYELSPEQELALGRAVAARVLYAQGLNNALPAQDPTVQYLSRVGNTVAALAFEHTNQTDLLKHLTRKAVRDRPWPLRGYHFLVVDAAAPNAWGMPGGYVIVTTGLLKLVGTEDELAGVLAHEVAHVQRGHGVEMVKEAMCRDDHRDDGLVGTAKLGVSNIGVLGKRDKASINQLVDGLAGTLDELASKGYGSDLEEEADALAVRYAAFSGYGPGGLVAVLSRLPDAKGSTFSVRGLSNHPPSSKRIALLGQLMQREKLPSTVESGKAREARFKAAFPPHPGPLPENGRGSANRVLQDQSAMSERRQPVHPN